MIKALVNKIKRLFDLSLVNKQCFAVTHSVIE